MDNAAPVDRHTPQPPLGIAEALTAHLIRQEALHRAEHDLPYDLRLAAMTAAISARVTADAARAREARDAAARIPSSPLPPPKPQPSRTAGGAFDLPWF